MGPGNEKSKKRRVGSRQKGIGEVKLIITTYWVLTMCGALHMWCLTV